MGLMRCDRNGCEYTCCDVHITDVGYICPDCQSEFIDYLEENNKSNLTERQLIKELNKFLKTETNSYSNKVVENVSDFFRKHNSSYD